MQFRRSFFYARNEPQPLMRSMKRWGEYRDNEINQRSAVYLVCICNYRLGSIQSIIQTNIMEEALWQRQD